MSKKHAVADVFDALMDQTRQRGGSPSVREISDAALAVQNLVAAYTEVRANAVEAGMSHALARAIEVADAALAVVQGSATSLPDGDDDEAVKEWQDAMDREHS